MSQSPNRTVDVQSDAREIKYYDRTGSVRTLGVATIETFEGENIRRHVFHPDPSSPWATSQKKQEGYALGLGTSHLSVVNPIEAQQVFLDKGWEIADQYASGGGLELVTVFHDPRQTFEEVLQWDRKFWEELTYHHSDTPISESPRVGLSASVTLSTNMMIGRMGVRSMAGFMRWACTNGVRSKYFDFPTVEFPHKAYTPQALSQKMAESGFPQFSSVPKGPVVAQRPHLNRAAGIIKEYSDELLSDAGPGLKWEGFEKEFKVFDPEMMSASLLRAYNRQLNILLDNTSEREIYLIDLVNAYTNAVSVHRKAQSNERGIWHNLGLLELVIDTTTRLARMSALFG